MKTRLLSLILATTPLTPVAMAGTGGSVWSSSSGPSLPLHYIESIRISQNVPRNAPAETYAPQALFMLLYPSINDSNQDSIPQVANTVAATASKNSAFQQFRPRVNLSPSYVQEFAYIDTYSNIGKYRNNFPFPSIRMSLPLPWFGGGFGGGYQGLQFGLGSQLFRF